MIKDTNRTIRITLTKKQLDWLERFSKDLKLSKSKTIAWLLSKKASEIGDYIRRMNNQMSDEEMEEIIRIAKTPWLDL